MVQFTLQAKFIAKYGKRSTPYSVAASSSSAAKQRSSSRAGKTRHYHSSSSAANGAGNKEKGPSSSKRTAAPPPIPKLPPSEVIEKLEKPKVIDTTREHDSDEDGEGAETAAARSSGDGSRREVEDLDAAAVAADGATKNDATRDKTAAATSAAADPATATSPTTTTTSVQCQLCGRSAFVDQVVSPKLGVFFHQACFQCAQCQRQLDEETGAQYSVRQPAPAAGAVGASLLCSPACVAAADAASQAALAQSSDAPPPAKSSSAGKPSKTKQEPGSAAAPSSSSGSRSRKSSTSRHGAPATASTSSSSSTSHKSSKRTCVRCQKTVVGERVKVAGKVYHTHCIRCSSCDSQLIGASAATKTVIKHTDKGEMLCVPCFEKQRASVKCYKCRLPITSKAYLSVAGRKFHETGCLRCHECDADLDPSELYSKNNELVCSKCSQ